MPKQREPRRPTVDDVDPEALAADATDDQTRLHQDPEATEPVQSASGEQLPVDSEGRPRATTRDTGRSPEESDREE